MRTPSFTRSLLNTTRFATVAVGLCFALGLHVTPARADSSTSSAASMASESVGSLSNSVGTSSKSSSGDNKVADGNYRVMRVHALAERPGMLRVHMAADRASTASSDAVASNGELTVALWLDLPAKTWDGSGLQAGDTVNVSHRAYGLAFARHAGLAKAPDAALQGVFYLALNDAWRNDLASKPVLR